MKVEFCKNNFIIKWPAIWLGLIVHGYSQILVFWIISVDDVSAYTCLKPSSNISLGLLLPHAFLLWSWAKLLLKHLKCFNQLLKSWLSHSDNLRHFVGHTSKVGSVHWIWLPTNLPHRQVSGLIERNITWRHHLAIRDIAEHITSTNWRIFSMP